MGSQEGERDELQLPRLQIADKNEGWYSEAFCFPFSHLRSSFRMSYNSEKDLSFVKELSSEHIQDPEDNSRTLEKIVEWKVMAKIDYRVVPMLCLLYLLAFLDR